MKPKISIITITYNSEKTVRNTFDSVRRQHYENLEYIVIDGGSKDSTLSIAEEYSDIITTIISEPDEGISDAMNKGISYATGNLIGIIHSDDMLEEGALNKLSEEWDGKTDVYYGDVIVCSKIGERMHILRGSDRLSDMEYGFCISHPSTFVTKKAYEKYGVYDTELKCCMDYDQFLRMYKQKATFKHIKVPLALFRIGGTNQIYRSQTIKESCMISKKYGGNPIKADIIMFKKKAVDIIRPFAHRLGIHNQRVKQERTTDL